MKTRNKASSTKSKKRFQFHPERAQPKIGQSAAEIQAFGTIAKLPNALGEQVCQGSVERLNQMLADTMTLRDLYKKHHWQVSGNTFYQLHLLFDKHYDEQVELIDQIAERIKQLGGKPEMNPAALTDLSHSEYREGTSLADMIREDLIAERIAISSYREIIKFFGDKDSTSRIMLEGILAKEEEHADELTDLLFVVAPETGETTDNLYFKDEIPGKATAG
jgi:bacterioferritin